MRGVSASTLDDVLAAVETAADSVSGHDLGSDLFGVVGVLDATPALRRMLTDPSTEADARGDLAETVFGDAVGSGAVAVVRTAVQGRWSSARDLADGLETAGVSAVVAGADAGGDLDALETELFEIGRVVASDDDLRGTVSDRAVPAGPKSTLLGNLVEGKVSDAALALAQQAVVARTGSFEKVLTQFGETAAARRDRLVATVRTARELDADQRRRLAAALGRRYGHDVHLNTIVDPDVLGGLQVSVGAEVVDGSMSSRLETARRRIAG